MTSVKEKTVNAPTAIKQSETNIISLITAITYITSIRNKHVIRHCSLRQAICASFVLINITFLK